MHRGHVPEVAAHLAGPGQEQPLLLPERPAPVQDQPHLLVHLAQQMRLILHESRAFRQHERLFLARTGQVRRELGDVAAMHASDGIAAWRWWTLAELEGTDEQVWPPGLAAIIRTNL